MAWVNASGTPVAMQPLTIQIDVPCEAVGDTGAAMAAVNWPGVMAAAIQLIIALMSSNPTAIAAAIQAFLKALMGR